MAFFIKLIASFSELAQRIAFAADGQTWAAAEDGKLVVFREGLLLHKADAGLHVSEIAFAKEGGHIHLGPLTWNSQTCQFMGEKEALAQALVAGLPPSAQEEQFTILQGAPSPDGTMTVVRTQYLPPRRPGAAAYTHTQSRLLLLHTGTYALLHELSAKGAGIGWRTSVFNADGTRVAAASEQLLALWECASGQLVATQKIDFGAVDDLRFSPDGTWLAMASNVRGKSISLWNAETLSPACAWEGDTHAVHALAFVADGTRLFSGGDDQELCLWSVPDGKRLQSASISGRIRALAVDAEAHRLALATWLPSDPQIQLYELGSLVS